MNDIYGRDYLALTGRQHICVPKPRALPWADILPPFRPLERGHCCIVTQGIALG